MNRFVNERARDNEVLGLLFSIEDQLDADNRAPGFQRVERQLLPLAMSVVSARMNRMTWDMRRYKDSVPVWWEDYQTRRRARVVRALVVVASLVGYGIAIVTC